jgi:uncharacterized protein (DUF2062 family)
VYPSHFEPLLPVAFLRRFAGLRPVFPSVQVDAEFESKFLGRWGMKCRLVSVPDRLLVRIEVGMVMVMAVVMAMMRMFDYYNLCLQWQRRREAKDENDSKPERFHNL